MSRDAPEETRLALEHAFLAPAGRERDRAELDPHDLRPEALSAASGITDPALLARLVLAGVECETITALSLVPLVVVAWADGTMDGREREALLRAAADSGLERTTPAFRLFGEWLEQPPAPELVEAWIGYLHHRLERMEEGARRVVRLHLLGRARRVAEAAGHLLGHASPISPAEAAMLARLELAFET